MKIIQRSFSALPALDALNPLLEIQPQLILAFAPPAMLQNAQMYTQLRAAFPDVLLAGASSGGNISKKGIEDQRLQLTAIHLDDPALAWASASCESNEHSFAAGCALGEQLARANVRYVLLFSHRHNTSNHRLIQGLKHTLPGIPIAGGIATNPQLSPAGYTLSPEGISDSQHIAIGFCSLRIQTRQGVSSGWQPFGPARRVTRSAHHILHELDKESALAVYRRFLGPHINAWHIARQLFSFEMLDADRKETGLIRAVQAFDEDSGSLILTDDIIEGGYLRLMHASTHSLVDGAKAALDQALQLPLDGEEKLAFIVSCVARRAIMGQQAEDEIDVLLPDLNAQFSLAGFYSHGEFGTPGGKNTSPQVLNETVSITLLSESPC